MSGRLRITNFGLNLDVAGIITSESVIRRIIFRYICQDIDNPSPEEVQLAQQVEAECFRHLAPHYPPATIHDFDGLVNPSIAGTRLYAARLIGNTCLVDITAEADTTHTPLFLLCEKFPQYGVVYAAGRVRFTSENGYEPYLGVITHAINEVLDKVLGVTQRVSAQDLRPVLDNSGTCETEIPTKALFLDVHLEEDPETGAESLTIELSNWLDRWFDDTLPPGARLPHVNEVALLVQFVKTLNERFLAFCG